MAVLIDPYLHNVPRIDMPRYAVLMQIKYGSEDIAWFWDKKLALEYLEFKKNQKKGKSK